MGNVTDNPSLGDESWTILHAIFSGKPKNASVSVVVDTSSRIELECGVAVAGSSAGAGLVMSLHIDGAAVATAHNSTRVTAPVYKYCSVLLKASVSTYHPVPVQVLPAAAPHHLRDLLRVADRGELHGEPQPTLHLQHHLPLQQQQPPGRAAHQLSQQH